MDTKRLRQRVLDLAIHGKLVPQNPQDEPASELLKRIAEEKERLIKEGKIKKSKKKDNEDIDEVPFKVPQGWVWTKLDDVIDVRDGTHDTPKYIDKGYPLITSKDFKNGKFDLTNTKYISKEDYLDICKRSNVEVGDILYSMIGGNIGSQIDISESNFFEMAIKNVALFKPYNIKVMDNSFLSIYLKWSVQAFQEIAAGGAQSFVGLNVFRKSPFPLPPLAEQHRIVLEVEKYFSLIDILEESENNLQQSIQKAKSKILDLAIKGKLVEKTGEWEEKKLGDICNYGKCITVNVEDIAPDSWVLELEDIEKDTARIQNRISRQERVIKGTRHSFKKGDILYSKLRTYLNKVLVAKEDGFCTTEIIPIKPNECITAEFLCHMMRSKYFIDYTVQCGYGVKMPRLSTTDAKKAIIPLPPLAEQHRIVAKIEELFTQLDNIAEALK